MQAHRRGENEDARGQSLEVLTICQQMGRRMLAAWALLVLAPVEAGLGRPVRGALVFGAGHQALDALGSGIDPSDEADHDRARAELVKALGDEPFGTLLGQGRSMSLDEAIALVRAD